MLSKKKLIKMLSRVNKTVYAEGLTANESNDRNASWAQNEDMESSSQNKDEQFQAGELSTFKSVLEAAEGEDWYGGEQNIISLFSPSFTEVAADHHSSNNNQHLNTMMLNNVASSASKFNASHDVIMPHQVNYFFPSNNSSNIPALQQGTSLFDLSFGSGYLENNNTMNRNNLSSLHTQFGGGFRDGSIENSNNSVLFFNSSDKILKPLDHNFAASSSVGSQKPTLFEKRASLKITNNLGHQMSGHRMKSSSYVEEDVYYGDSSRKRKAVVFNGGDDFEDDLSLDGDDGSNNNLNYDSDDLFFDDSTTNVVNQETSNNIRNDSNTNSTAVIDQKGKRKGGPPAKNLMAERRRRKKLNDRLYMLRSVVPKISKMDRASILGDAIDYLKELLQKINDLHNELESSTPTPNNNNTAPPIKEEMYQIGSSFPSSLSSPTTAPQPPSVEVRLREGRAVNIHMFCGRRPGILQSTLRAMDSLGLDVQQAVISCFNGFALDIFRAEQCDEGQEDHVLNPDEIKDVLIESAGFHGDMVV